MSNKSFNFTRNRIRDLPVPNSGRAIYADSSTKGLQLRISVKGVKSFSFLGKLDGRAKRVTIGEFNDITVKHTQGEAHRLRALLKDGIDPVKAKRSTEYANITLSECLEDYLRLHTKLASSTVEQYRREINKYLKSWLTTPLKNIGRAEIATKHRTMSKKSPAIANRVMRVLRAIFNFANQEYEDENGQTVWVRQIVSTITESAQ